MRDEFDWIGEIPGAAGLSLITHHSSPVTSF